MGAQSARSFRRYQVVAKQVESSLITSFWLRPVDGEPLPEWQAGQYLSLRVPVGDTASVIRHYSVSGQSTDESCWRISVKLEQAPAQSGLPDGVGSGYLHHSVQIGDELEAAGPFGDFTLDAASARPTVLIAAGVGVTPLLAMLQQLGRQRRKVYFFHACRNQPVQAFAQEIQALSLCQPDWQTLSVYQQAPNDGDSVSGPYTQGVIDQTLLQAKLPLDDYDFYLCGPGVFMQSVYGLLRSLGVTQTRIRYEFFGPACVLESTVAAYDAQPQPQPQLTPALVEDAVLSDTEVRFLPSGVHAQWQEPADSLLVLAEQAGLSPNFNCRSGLCNTCLCRLVSGDVEYIEEPLDEVPEGQVLLCCARPKGAVCIELPSD